jgi:hypothetical protein
VFSGLAMFRWVKGLTLQAASNAKLMTVIEQTDFNTGEFTDNVREEVTVELQRFLVKVRLHLLNLQAPLTTPF